MATNPLLDALLRNESGGRNIPNTHEGTSSGQAQGHFQITTGTWKDFGGTKYAPTPLGATYEQQAEIASKIPLKRWDNSTIAAMRGTGMPVDPSRTLGENLGGNFTSSRYGLSGPRPGLQITSLPQTPGSPAPTLPPPIDVPDMPVAQVAAGTDPVAATPSASPIMDAITKLTTEGKDGKASPLGALAKLANPSAGQERRPDPIIQTGAIQSSDALQGQQMVNAQQLMQSLIAKRKSRTPGFGIGGMMG